MKHLKRFRRLTRSNLSPVFAVYSLCCWEVETLVPILFALLSISSFVIMSELPPPPRRDEGASARPSIFSLIPSSSSSCFWLLIGFVSLSRSFQSRQWSESAGSSGDVGYRWKDLSIIFPNYCFISLVSSC